MGTLGFLNLLIELNLNLVVHVQFLSEQLHHLVSELKKSARNVNTHPPNPPLNFILCQL